MKVKELIEILKPLDPEAEVILSKDAEGNNYSPLSDYSSGKYIPDSTWSGEFESRRGKYNAICLWPTN